MNVSRLSTLRKDCLADLRSPTHTKHFLVQMVRQRVYQIAAGYEDCNDADYLRIDPALRLAIGKDHQTGAAGPGSPGWRTISWASGEKIAQILHYQWVRGALDD